MKIKIQKFQLGGDFASLAVNYIPTSASTTAGAYAPAVAGSSDSSSKSSSKSDELSIKDVLKVFDNVKGLPIDVQYVLKDFKEMFEDDTLFSFSGKPSYSSLVSYYLNNIGKFNMLAQSKENYEEARKELVVNNSLDEIAIDRNGRVIVSADGSIDAVTLDEFKKGNYKALTNRELLNLRQTKLPFGDSIYSNMTGVGMDQVIKKVNSLVQDLGTSEKKIEGYTTKQSDAIKSGLAILQDKTTDALEAGTLTVDGLYKNSVITKDQKEQAQLALKAVYNSLTPQERTLLALHSVGGDPTETVSNLILSRTSSTYHFEPTLQTSLNIDGAKKESSKTTKELGDENDNPLQDLINMQGGTTLPVYFVRSDGNESMGTFGVHWTKLTEKDPGTTSVSNMLNKTGIGGVVRSYGGITFGDIQIPSEFLKDIMYKEGGGTVVILPAKYDTMGNQMVDLSLLDDFKEITKSVSQYKQGTNEWWAEVAKKVKEKGLSQYLLGDGQVDKRQFGTFLMVEGYTTDSVLKNINPSFKESTYMENEGSDANILQTMQQALSTDGGKTPYEVDTANWLNPFDWFGLYDDVYHANVFIPLTNNNLQATNAWGQSIKESSALRKQADYQADYSGKLDRDINSGSDILNQ